MHLFATPRLSQSDVLETILSRLFGNSLQGPEPPEWQPACEQERVFSPGGPLRARHYDDWTIESWRIEPRVRPLDPADNANDDGNPPLWKDLTLASIVAGLLWGAAALIFA